MHAVWIWSAIACREDKEEENDGEMSITGMVKSSPVIVPFTASLDSRYAVERASWKVVKLEGRVVSISGTAMVGVGLM